MRATRRVLVAIAVGVLLVATATPAAAHDHRLTASEPPIDGPPAPAVPETVVARAELAPPQPGAPSVVPIRGTVTNLENSFATGSAACAFKACFEVQIRVPEGARSLYATVGWQLPSHYVHIWGISPTGKVIGRGSVGGIYDKTVGNERTINRSQFTVDDPEPGLWRIQVRAVWGVGIDVEGAVAVSATPAVRYDRLGVRELGDAFGSQSLRMNVVFVGREPGPAMVKSLKEKLPDEFRPAVLAKQFPDCDGPVLRLGPECADPYGIRNWSRSAYSGTSTTSDDTPTSASGVVPFLEPLKWSYSYKFFAASPEFTDGLFDAMRQSTTRDAPFDRPNHRRDPETAVFLQRYNAERGRFRGADAAVVDASRADQIDAFAVEDWIFEHRDDPRYAEAFVDLETGERRDGRFITPDPAARYDPFYDGGGRRDIDRMPQGPMSNMTVFVLDTFTTPVARKHLRPNAYHSFDVSRHVIDDDTKEEDAPDYMRFWGGRYRFFMLDLGAMPNAYEADGNFFAQVGDSANPPNGDPPIWEAMSNPVWGGEAGLYDRIARTVRTTMFSRFTASYLYRPLPADVYFLASNTWSDHYSRPEGGGVSHTVLDRIYNADRVERNLSSALPAATFVTERSDPRLKTYRYLGCSDRRFGGRSRGSETMVPDSRCTNPDPYQVALEQAKAQGGAGGGVNDLGVSPLAIRRFVEERRDELAPLRPGQLTIASLSVVFPGVTTFASPALTGGIALNTPNEESWGIVQNVNDQQKTHLATDCSKSLPVAPGCGVVPPNESSRGLSYVVEHEASHAFGLLHPHDMIIVEPDDEGRWRRYAYQYALLPSFSMAPTTYAGSIAPYSVIDQDIIQRGHYAEYLRMAQDWLSDAYLQDGVSGLSGPSSSTRRKRAEMERWRAQGAQRLACGDYLHALYAARNATLAAQGVFGPVVKPRALQPGERVLFEVNPQPAYGADGVLAGCHAAASTGRQAGRLPATGSSTGTVGAALALLALAGLARRGRRLA